MDIRDSNEKKPIVVLKIDIEGWAYSQTVAFLKKYITEFNIKIYKTCALVETVEGYGASFFADKNKGGLDKLIYCSEGIKNSTLSLIYVHTDRIHILPNPVDLETPIKKGKLKKIIKPKKKLIGWVGRLSPEKNPDLFIRMANELANKFEFVMIGEAWSSKLNIEYLEKMRKCKAKINWIRDVAPEDMINYIADLDLLCNTSYTEGHPFTMIEAMAVKVPVVSMPVGSVPDLIKDNKTGFFAYNEDEYSKIVKKALKNKNKVIEQAYANVLVNHNLKDYIRKMEIHYLEALYNFEKGR